MQKNVNVLVSGLVLLFVLPLYAQKSIDLDQITGTHYYASPLEITEEGETFVLTATGGDAGYEFQSLNDFAGELIMGSDGSGGTVKITITHKDGYIFDFTSIDLLISMGGVNWTIKGYRSGSQVSGSPCAAVLNSSSYTTVSPNFLQVDQVTIEENPVNAGGFMVWCDNFVVDNVNDGSLPVSLTSFSGRCEKQSVVLEWTTESETNNLGFILEKSVDKQTWTTIASYLTDKALKGQGNTSSSTDYTFTDPKVEPETTYTYRLSDVSTDGKVNVYASLNITMDALPKMTDMEKAYPNPFNPQTHIAYHLAKEADVEITVFNILGRQIKTLHSGRQVAGSYHVYWNATNNSGDNVPTGTFLICMQAGDIYKIQKVLLIK